MSASGAFKRVALIGFGLIGGSIARAARQQGELDLGQLYALTVLKSDANEYRSIGWS